MHALWFAALALAAPFEPGSASFQGLAPADHLVWVGGEELPWVPELEAYVLPATRARTYGMSITRRGHVVLTADLSLAAGRNQACLLMPAPSGLPFHVTCRSNQGVIALQDLSDSTAYGGGGRVFVPAEVVAVEGPPTPRVPIRMPPVRPAGPTMDQTALDTLVAAVRDATFGDGQVDVLRTAAAHNKFTCTQVVQLLAPISSEITKVEAVEALEPAVVDPGNAHLVEAAFTFTTDKEKVRALFR